MNDKERKNKQKREDAMARFKAMKKSISTEEDFQDEGEEETKGVLPEQNLKRNLGCG